jgi:hypothetical protein
MRVGVYLPPAALRGERVPAVYFLAGLTCTDETFAMKAGAQRLASELGLCLVTPDTSPRATRLPGDDASWDFGLGAGFYLDATEAPWSAAYQMERYVVEELPAWVEARFPVRRERAERDGALHGRPRRAHPRAAQPGPLRERVGLRAHRGALRGALGAEGLRGLPRAAQRGVGGARRVSARRAAHLPGRAAHRPGPRRQVSRAGASARALRGGLRRGGAAPHAAAPPQATTTATTSSPASSKTTSATTPARCAGDRASRWTRALAGRIPRGVCTRSARRTTSAGGLSSAR